MSLVEWPFPTQEWTGEAKQRLNRRMQAYEPTYAKPRLSRVRRFAVPVLATAAAALIGIAGWLRWTGKQPAQLRPTEVIAGISRAEQAIYVQPVEQTFAVEITAIRPLRQSVKATLQVWSDRATGRFASRFSEAGGKVQHALWRPSSNEEFVYRPAVSSVVRKQHPHREEVVALESLAEYGLGPDELEATFLHWLESRSWSPISFASDIALWASADVAAAERLRSEDGTAVLRVTAQRKSGRMVALLAVEVDSQSYRPRLQTIRFETPERTVEFRLAATRIQPIRQREMSANMFRPAPEFAPELRTPKQPPQQPGAPAPPAALPVPSGEAAIDPRALEAQFVLHRAGACSGDSVRVSEESGWTRVDRLGREPDSYRVELGISFVLGALADLRRNQPAPGDQGAHALALRNAWAMRRLGEDFPAQHIGSLSPASRQMLRAMLSDHVEAVRRELAALGLPVPKTSKPVSGKPDWRKSASLLFDALAYLNSSPTPQSPPSAPGLSAIGAYLDDILGGFSIESGSSH